MTNPAELPHTGDNSLNVPLLDEAIALVFAWEQGDTHQSELIARLWSLWHEHGKQAG